MTTWPPSKVQRGVIARYSAVLQWYLADAPERAVPPNGWPEASVRALDKLLITGDFMKNITTTILWRPDASLWGKQTEFVDAYPQRQRARLRRIDQLSAVSVYSTHPAASRRIACLSADPVPGSTPAFPAERLSRIDAELEPQLRLMAENMRREVYRKLTPAQLERLGRY